jgi:hypothetical protein
MAAALRFGRGMLGRIRPSPAVGSVIVREGAIVGQGQTQPRDRMPRGSLWTMQVRWQAAKQPIGDAGTLLPSGQDAPLAPTP